MGGVIGMLIIALIGLIIGTIAKLLLPGPDPGGWFLTILLGIAGSWVGGWWFALLGLDGLGGGLVGAVRGMPTSGRVREKGLPGSGGIARAALAMRSDKTATRRYPK
jgi:uncharacterized membrane protein YeaQ/YmgE (transglycosylase-associated protein family)